MLLYIYNMRFVPKFVNGYWRLFDRQEYREVGIFDLQRDAQAAADAANVPVAVASRRGRH